MADDLSLLFRLRAQNQASPVIHQVQADVAKLRNTFGPELATSIGVGQKALQSIGSSVENLVSQRLPLLGSAVVSVSSGLRQVAAAAGESRASVDGAGLSFAEIGAITHRTEAQVAGFITSLSLLKTEAARNTAVVGFLGGALASTLRPQLDEAAKAGTELNKVLQASGRSTGEALRLVRTLGLIGDASQRNAAAVALFGDTTAKRLLPRLEKFGSSLGVIAAASGRSGAEVAEFVARFARLGTEVEKRTAAVEFFGASLATKLGPELTKTGAALAGVSAESAVAGSAVAGMAGPIGIAVLALAALTAGAVLAAREIFQLTKRAADFQGRMFDLAQQTGLAVETLSAFEVLARTTGGSVDTIAQAVFNFQRKLDDAQDPLSQTAELFRRFQIDTSDTETSLRSAFNALARMPEGFAQTNAAAELFGARGGKQVLAILKETNGDLDATIKKLRDAGILISEDAARAADKFNDELALLEFKLRGLVAAAAEDLIPVIAEMIRGFGDFVTAIRPVASLLGSIAGAAFRPAAQAARQLSTVVAILTGDYEALARAIKKAREEQNIGPISIPDLTPERLPQAKEPLQAASEAVNQADALVSAIKRSVAVQNQALDELFQQGRRTRERQAEETIAANRRVLEAEKQSIDAKLELKKQEILALDQAQRDRGEIINRETAQHRAINAEVSKLQQEQLDKGAEFAVTSRAIRAKAAQERADFEREQAQINTQLLVAEIDKHIRIIEEGNKRRAQIEPLTFGDLSERLQEERNDLTVIQLLEKAKIDLRREGLEKQQQIGNLTIEEQKRLNNQINQLNQEADLLAQEHADRRIEVALDEVRRFGEVAQLLINAQLANADASLRVGQINDQARIASTRALADLRVKTEEQAERGILQIRLDAIDREKDLADIALEAVNARTQAEIEAIRVRRRTVEDELKKAGAIEDPATRLREQVALTKEQTALVDAEIAIVKRANAEKEKAEADHNNQVRVLNAERTAIQAQGNRDIDEGRERDIQNERSYQNELRQIKERIRDIERDTAEEVIRLMLIHFARRKDIIRARLQADIEDENARHRNATETINNLERENRESKKTAEEKLEAEKEINRLREAEAERHRLAMQGIRDQGKKDDEEADPLGRLNLDTESLEEFASVLEDSIVPLGEILQGTFRQVADAIGQVIENWVLLGETGPAVGRKILAAALANLAREAAINAIKELALGFATLFFNPAESASHFTAAALWGSIAGGAALAGRGVAGDLFKSKNAGAGGGGSSQGARDLNPLTFPRNQPQPPNERRIVIEVRPDGSKFGQAVTAVILDDGKNAGPIREFFKEDRTI